MATSMHEKTVETMNAEGSGAEEDHGEHVCTVAGSPTVYQEQEIPLQYSILKAGGP